MLLAHFTNQRGQLHNPLVRPGGSQDRSQLYRPRRRHQGMDATPPRWRAGQNPVLQRDHLSPRESGGYHGFRPRPLGQGTEGGLPVRRRVPPEAAPRPSPDPVDGQQRAEHQRRQFFITLAATPWPEPTSNSVSGSGGRTDVREEIRNTQTSKPATSVHADHGSVGHILNGSDASLIAFRPRATRFPPASRRAPSDIPHLGHRWRSASSLSESATLLTVQSSSIRRRARQLAATMFRPDS